MGSYGDLTKLNSSRVLMDAVGKNYLNDIAKGYLTLLESSVAIYEANGDYATALFTSGYCRFLDEASRQLCNTVDNSKALASGKWHCHESCWNRSSRVSIETKKPYDLRWCDGGINIYAVPIISKGKAIGAISLGYGSPPDDLKSLEEISDHYEVDVKELCRVAKAYKKRPNYVIKASKRLVKVAAEGIGEIYKNATLVNELNESVTELHDLYDNAPDMFCSVDVESGMVVQCNQTLATNIGLSKKEIIGQPVFDLYHPDSRASAHDSFQEFIETGRIYRNDLQLLQKDGKKLSVSLRVTAVRDKSGKILRSQSIWRDNTKQKQTEETLRQSEERLHLAVLNAPIPVIMHAEDGEILLISNKWTELSGYTLSDIPTILDWTAKAYRANEERVNHQREVINALYDLKKPSQHDAYITTASGEKRIWQFHDAPLGHLPDGRRFLISMAVDVTERKRAEETLRDSEERFRSAFENVAVGNIVINDKGIIEFFNSAAKKIFGYNSGEVIGENVSMLMPEPYRSNHDQSIRKYLETGKANIVGVGREVTGLRKSGEEFPMHLGVGEMVIGDTCSFVGSISDLTQMKALESQLHQAQKMESIGQLTGGIAHDFNNLMGVILGSLELAEDSKMDDERNELISEAKMAVYRGASLTQQLLAFSLQQALSPEVVDANDLVLDSLKLVKRTLRADITVEARLSEEPIPVKIDADLFGTALLNLSLNARDAMPSGGQLVMATRRVELDGDLTGEDKKPIIGPHAQITVSDTGCGISKDHLERVIEPFFTTKEVGEGSGLGLSMVYGFLKQSGGHLKIDSERGKGTTISLYLPLTDEKTQKDADFSASHQPIPQSRTILVVEDDLSVLKTTSRMLTGLGYEVIEAADGPSAVEVLAEKSDTIDLVFSDVVMPKGMNGMELAERVRNKYKHIKVLLTSGYPDVARQESLEHAGIDLLAKPYKRAELARAIENAFDS